MCLLELGIKCSNISMKYEIFKLNVCQMNKREQELQNLNSQLLIIQVTKPRRIGLAGYIVGIWHGKNTQIFLIKRLNGKHLRLINQSRDFLSIMFNLHRLYVVGLTCGMRRGDDDENCVRVKLCRSTDLGDHSHEVLKRIFCIRLEVVTRTAKHDSHTRLTYFNAHKVT